MDYGAEVWGVLTECRALSSAQNRALGSFKGVGIHHHITALEIEGGWMPVRWRVKLKALMYWHRLMKLTESNIVKRVLNDAPKDKSKTKWLLLRISSNCFKLMGNNYVVPLYLKWLYMFFTITIIS